MSNCACARELIMFQSGINRALKNPLISEVAQFTMIVTKTNNHKGSLRKLQNQPISPRIKIKGIKCS